MSGKKHIFSIISAKKQHIWEKHNILKKACCINAYSPSRLSAGKSLGIKPSPAARVLYCLSFFSADKRSSSGIYCVHNFIVESKILVNILLSKSITTRLNILSFLGEAMEHNTIFYPFEEKLTKEGSNVRPGAFSSALMCSCWSGDPG